MELETITIHAGLKPEPVTGAIITPVFQTSTYVQKGIAEHSGYEYSRSQNPTREALEANIAALEGASAARAFASGCAATTTLLHTLKAGDHVVCVDDVYGGTSRLFRQVMEKMGLDFSFVDLTEAEQLTVHLQRNTRAVWVETPTNPLLKIIDLEALCHIAHQHGAQVFCDNTFATPAFQKPLALGCDAVVHSTTKFINGHSDVVGGVVCCNDPDLAEQIAFLQNTMGAVPGPWDAWLVLRGLKTFALRMRAHDSNGRAVAAMLEESDKISRVYYPGLESHPNHAIAKRQMSGFGGMISLVLKGGLEASRQLVASLKLFSLAESLGGVESLVEHPALMTHASVPSDVRAQLGIDDGLVRLSVGVEHIDDLKEDLLQALATCA